ncbi:MAG: TolC family protein, partial [Chloroflexi bacterium]|nr:TolC family protein [Chloroflexota bacterium]
LPQYGRGTFLLSDTLNTGVALEKSFRSGMAVASSLSVGRLAHSALTLPAKRAMSSLTVVLPLAGGRGGGAAVGNERAAERSYDASRLDRDHVSARVVRDATVAYWQYVGADERLRIYKETEARAERLVAETEVLIRADERPASDLDLMAGNLASAQAARVAAEQIRLEARYSLGLAMGLTAATIAALGPPSTPFPAPEDVSGRGPREVIVRTALAKRRDLAAARTRRNGARMAWEGAVRDLRPRWDVVGGIGHMSISSALLGGDLLEPPPGSGTGLNASVQVRYAPTATNSAVQGAALRADVAHRTATVVAEDLARRVRANALVAAEALDNAMRETSIAAEALRLSQRAVETEREKFRLGLATVFDAILAEDTLTKALLRRTDARLRYAVALARLRFETGTLLRVSAGSVAADSDAALGFDLPEDQSQ